ncbi:hypothetical protein [Streptomyces sp. NPDC019890]|uniref:hypothetical protein n=1 Tax=Streptomyces sp. NPDC019890 TaxID=3365064 RepID=UPI00384C0D3D
MIIVLPMVLMGAVMAVSTPDLASAGDPVSAALLYAALRRTRPAESTEPATAECEPASISI